MIFDPFNDYETKGYLRNFLLEKDLHIIKHLEHGSFVVGISAAFEYLASVKKLCYRDVLHAHKLLFGELYPWAGQDRVRTAPDIAVSKGNVLFAHPRDARAAVEYALRIGSDPASMKEKPGEVMGYLAYGHPFLEGNGRTMMVVHAELARRADISIDWTATSKTAYLAALTKELENPGAGFLDAYLKPFIRKAVETDVLAGHVVSTRGLDGSDDVVEENKIFGKVSDPETRTRYQKQKLQRRKRQKREAQS